MANWERLNKELEDALNAMTDEEWVALRRRNDDRRTLSQTASNITSIDDLWQEYRSYTNNEDAWCFKEWLKSRTNGN